MVYNTRDYWVLGFVHHPVFQGTQKKLVLETGSVSVLR
jgi:hypothetical protein